MAVTKRARYEVMRRDGWRCRYCGAGPDDGARLTVDHVTPRALGGSDAPENLVTACTACNSGKSSVHPDSEIVGAAATQDGKWRTALKTASDANPVMNLVSSVEPTRRNGRPGTPEERATQDRFRAAWRECERQAGVKYPLDMTWRGTITGFIRSGLTGDDLQSLMSVAVASNAKDADKWRYFCGCCWTRIRLMQEAAEDELAAERQEAEPEESIPCDCVDADGTVIGHERSAECDAFFSGTMNAFDRAYDAGFRRANALHPGDVLGNVIDFGYPKVVLTSSPADSWAWPDPAVLDGFPPYPPRGEHMEKELADALAAAKAVPF